MTLSLQPVKHQEIDNITMGILPNGETYLSLSGLARFCGVTSSSIIEFSQEWTEGRSLDKRRGKQIAGLMREWLDTDELPERLYVEISGSGSTRSSIHAVPEQICMAILDYYAHYADEIRSEALANYRTAARFGLRKYIYERLDFDESKQVTQSWQLFQERLLSNETPAGYYTMFNEGAQIIASLIKAGIPVDDTLMPDGSLGSHWGRYWKNNDFDQKFGKREKIKHNFPESYRQLDPEVWAYPNDSISIFRNWFDFTYLPEKYPKYIDTKIGQGKISKDKASLLVSAVMPPSLENKKK